MKIALAHDFLIRWGGAEKVLFDLHQVFPQAPIYTLFYDSGFIKRHFPKAKVKASYLQKRYIILQKLSFSKKTKETVHRLLTPSLPLAVEALDFSEYDIIISSSAGFMKGIVAPLKAKHICYLHTPTRWAWQDYHETLCLGRRKALKRIYAHFYRLWDYESAQRPDVLLANSFYTSKRIKRCYGREAKIVYPSAENLISDF